MKNLNMVTARKIIEKIGATGTPPEWGFQYFTSGIDKYLNIMEDEYFSTFIKDGGSTFKLITGMYGGGKTHFLYCLRAIAWKYKFVVSYVQLSPSESPFHQLDKVYKSVAENLTPPLPPGELLSGYSKGIVNLLKLWHNERYSDNKSKNIPDEKVNEILLEELKQIDSIENISFLKAIKSAFLALMQDKDDDFQNICQWLTCEQYDRRLHGKYGILQKIEKSSAFMIIRSLVQWIRQIGYSGMIILLDEAERVPSLSSKQQELHLNNLREVIDACGNVSFQNVMIYYAVPDRSFLDGKTQIYEALKQRLHTVFDYFNPSGVTIDLEDKNIIPDPIDFLTDIGQKLIKIYETAYSYSFNDNKVNEAISSIAKASYEKRHGDTGYKRLFVQQLIREFNLIRRAV
ncbi:MAG: DUF2791 family P-loop domain-containing protein [Bacteroidales bacterium]|nr:DUF2791 family P-loop domain-containing protein [Bacteroidales bacterium]